LRIRRAIEASVLKALADTRVVLLKGARQTGKTTMARKIAGRAGAPYSTLARRRRALPSAAAPCIP